MPVSGLAGAPAIDRRPQPVATSGRYQTVPGVGTAGNRALLKPSEYVPETAALFAEVVPKYFSKDEVAVVTGGADISQKFAELPVTVYQQVTEQVESDAGQQVDYQVHDFMGIGGNAKEITVEGEAEHTDRAP